jgi:competence protein ComEA
MQSSTISRRRRQEAETLSLGKFLFAAPTLAAMLAAAGCASSGGDSAADRGPAASSAVGAGASSTTGTTSESRSGASVARMVNINTASPQELNSLPDIGAERAQRIIRNRPYQRIEELRDREIIPKSVYDQINDRLTVR